MEKSLIGEVKEDRSCDRVSGLCRASSENGESERQHYKQHAETITCICTMIVTKLSMVSFFKTPAPVRYVEKQITLRKRIEAPVVSDSSVAENCQAEGKSIRQKVRCVEYGKALLQEGGSGYLFSGEIELRRVESADGSNGKSADGLEVVIRKYTGEWVGTVVYDYLYCGGEKCFDLSSGEFIKTVHHLEDEKYRVYVNYTADSKIALRMELCPGDEEFLQKCLQEYEAGMAITPCI